MGRSEKRERALAVQAELRRRQEALAAQCPFSRQEVGELLEFVSQRMFDLGLGEGLTYTEEWVGATRADREDGLAFLGALGVHSDWDVLMKVDPCAIFGPTETRLAWMPLDEQELRSLIDWIDGRIVADKCHHDLRFTRGWLEANGLPVATTEFALIAQGGGCDCEVVLNVEPESFYPASGRVH